MDQLLAVPIVLPMIGAAISILFGRARRLQRILGIATLSIVVAVSVVIFVEVDRNGPLVSQAGGWAAPVGISLVADRLSALLLLVGAAMLLGVLLYAIGEPGAERSHVGFQSVYLVLTAGVSASFLTGDLFTLFVAFEMMLTASYVLMTLGGRPQQVRAGMTYVVISLIASSLLITLIALIYAATGTVNLAELSTAMAELDPVARQTFGIMLLTVFGIKAALFPLYFWLPDSYPNAPSPVTAVFAGLLTKVGVYAILRTQTVLVPSDSQPRTLLLVLAGLTMLLGALGAVAQDDIRRLLSFNIVSHIGTMVIGLGIGTVAALAGTILYMVHHIVAKTALFLTAGLIEDAGGDGRISKLGGMVRTTPILAVIFLLPALNLAGIPPMSGFIGKLALIQAGLDEQQGGIVAVVLIASLLSLYSLLKIWSGVFWGAPAHDRPLPRPLNRWGGPPAMVVPTVALALASVGLALFAGPLYEFCTRAAADLVDRGGYVRAVLER